MGDRDRKADTWSTWTEKRAETDPSKTFINFIVIYTMILEVNKADGAKSSVDS